MTFYIQTYFGIYDKGDELNNRLHDALAKCVEAIEKATSLEEKIILVKNWIKVYREMPEDAKDPISDSQIFQVVIELCTLIGGDDRILNEFTKLI